MFCSRVLQHAARGVKKLNQRPRLKGHPERSWKHLNILWNLGKLHLLMKFICTIKSSGEDEKLILSQFWRILQERHSVERIPPHLYACFFHQNPTTIPWETCRKSLYHAMLKKERTNLSLYPDTHQKLMGSIIGWDTWNLYHYFQCNKKIYLMIKLHFLNHNTPLNQIQITSYCCDSCFLQAPIHSVSADNHLLIYKRKKTRWGWWSTASLIWDKERVFVVHPPTFSQLPCSQSCWDKCKAAPQTVCTEEVKSPNSPKPWRKSDVW